MSNMHSSCEYSEDELVPPPWINGELLENVLKNVKGFENEKLANFTIQPASRKGDHYASIMFRATIECTQETETETEPHAVEAPTNKKLLQVIIKSRPPLHTPKGRNLSETQIFENEWKMYTQVIPLLEAEWRRHGVAVQFAGRLLYATLHPQPVIVLEDLCLNGYDVLRGESGGDGGGGGGGGGGDSGRLFNLSEVEACLRKLAKWHAVSYKLTAQSSDSSNKARNNIDGAHQVPFVSGAVAMDPPRSAPTMHNAVTQMQAGLFKQNNLLRTAYIGGGVSCMIAALEACEVGGGRGDDVNDDGSSSSAAVAPKCGSFNGNAVGVGVGGGGGVAAGVGVGFQVEHSYLRKLRLLEPRIIAACVAMNDAFRNGICGPIYVLNHGDFHTLNIMIKRNPTCSREQLLEDDIIFIDFQMSFFGPSTFDLQYASFTLLSKDLRDHKREYLMQCYFEHFLESLKLLKFEGNPPTYDQLQADHKRWRHYELYLLAVNLPLTRLNAEKPHEVDINQIFDSAEYRHEFYKNPDYLDYLRILLPKYMENGYLD